VYTIPWKYLVLGERTKKEQNYCKLGKKGEIKKDDGRHHIIIIESID
jgi:hypothetical protein